MTLPRGRAPDKGGLSPNFKQKWVFSNVLGFYLIFDAYINGFYPFLGDIGHFWSPNFGRKLGMDNQLQIYKNQACLMPRRTVRAELC
jgi:hypothetical protein